MHLLWFHMNMPSLATASTMRTSASRKQAYILRWSGRACQPVSSAAATNDSELGSKVSITNSREVGFGNEEIKAGREREIMKNRDGEYTRLQ